MTGVGKAAKAGKVPRQGKIRARVASGEPVLALKRRGGEPTGPPPLGTWDLVLGTFAYCWSALISAGSAKTDASMGSVLIDLMVISICCPITDMEVRVGIFSPPNSR